MAEAKRRLAAILAADVAGYSRLMGDDEHATLETLNAYRAVFREHIENHAGRVVDTAGDSILAVFESVVEAVRCAADIQTELVSLNEALREDRRMHFRIGVNLGDIIEQDDGSVYGDGVNVAARLEALAEPGGVIVSEAAYRQVEDKTNLRFTDIGEHEVKNIVRPVRAYQTITGDGQLQIKRQIRFASGAIFASLGVAALVIISMGIWLTSLKETREDDPVLAAPILELPMGPVIAVLPFEGESNTEDYDYFAAGLSDDITTALSRFHDLFVIGNESTRKFAGSDADIATIAHELGLDYALKGKVRRETSTVRVIAQMLNASDGTVLWSETFDRELTATNVFAVQDEITSTVVATIAGVWGKLDNTRIKGMIGRQTDDLSAYDCVLRARAFYVTYDPGDFTAARDCLETAIEKDPDYAEAWAWLATLTQEEYGMGMSPRSGSLDRARSAARRALQLEPDNQTAVAALTQDYFFRGEFELAIDSAQRVVELNPNNPGPLAVAGAYTAFSGEWGLGVRLIRRAMALNPFYPGWYHFVPARDYLRKGQYKDSLREALQINLEGYGDYHALLAANYAYLGQAAAAEEEVAKLLTTNPDFVASFWTEQRKWLKHDDIMSSLLVGLRKAGLEIPDESQPPTN